MTVPVNLGDNVIAERGRDTGKTGCTGTFSYSQYYSGGAYSWMFTIISKEPATLTLTGYREDASFELNDPNSLVALEKWVRRQMKGLRRNRQELLVSAVDPPYMAVRG